MTFKPTKPSHSLGLMDKETGERGTIGAAWVNDDGCFTIKLNPGVVLSYEQMKGGAMTLRLFPRGEEGSD